MESTLEIACDERDLSTGSFSTWSAARRVARSFARSSTQRASFRVVTAVAVALMIGAAAAQAQNPPAQPGPNNPAVSTAGRNNADQPVAGANSFTQSQAMKRIEERGFSDVAELRKDDQGVWRGKADKAGTKADVSVDFQGNVNPAK